MRSNRSVLILLAVVASRVVGLPVETLPQKRLGRSSFINKQKHDTLPKTITSPEELRDLARKNALRQRGSANFRKAWRHWIESSVPSIRYELSENLPHPVNPDRFASLAFSLGVAADVGKMPSFSDAGARSGYALDFFCRARLLADFLIDVDNPSLPPFWKDVVREHSVLGGTRSTSAEAQAPLTLTSIGGGPGFDFVAAAMVSTFLAGGTDAAPIKATILDYEEGWGDLVEAMSLATQRILQQPQLSCQWGGKCDITKPLTHPHNTACLAAIPTTHVWTCQYCVAENAKELRLSDYVFFRDLMDAVPIGTVIVLTETTPRLWPDFHQLVTDHCPYMEVGFPNKRGPRMVLRKSEQTDHSLSDKDKEQLRDFVNMIEHHELKIGSGWERQTKKFRGSI
jgi:hypothetical protein